MGGWIKLHRDILSWEWWDEPAMVKAWLTILMLANSEDRKWHGQTVKAGSFVTSLGKLSASLGLPINRTRTVISRLKETGEITVQSNRHFTLVSVNNWEKYQDNDQTNDEENHKPQSADNQADNADFSEKVNIPQSICSFECPWDYGCELSKRQVFKKNACFIFLAFGILSLSL